MISNPEKIPGRAVYFHGVAYVDLNHYMVSTVQSLSDLGFDTVFTYVPNGIRSRVGGDKRTERNRVPSNRRGTGLRSRVA
jgi:hypothetical protein